MSSVSASSCSALTASPPARCWMISVVISTAISREGSRRRRLSSASSSEPAQRQLVEHASAAPRAPAARSPARQLDRGRDRQPGRGAVREQPRDLGQLGDELLVARLSSRRPSQAKQPHQRNPGADDRQQRREQQADDHERAEPRSDDAQQELRRGPLDARRAQPCRPGRRRAGCGSAARRGARSDRGRRRSSTPPRSTSMLRRAELETSSQMPYSPTTATTTNSTQRPRPTPLIAAAASLRLPRRRGLARRQLERRRHVDAGQHQVVGDPLGQLEVARVPVTSRSGPIGSASNRIARLEPERLAPARRDHRHLDHPPQPRRRRARSARSRGSRC